MYPPLVNLIFPINGCSDNVNTVGRQAILLHENFLLKDSLPIQCAVTCANQDDLITYITPKTFTKLPMNFHGMSTATPNAMRNINFHYYTEIEDVRTLLSTISQPFPSLLILDRLDFYLEQIDENEWDSSVAKLLGLLIDSLHFISEQRDQTCPLIATYSKEDLAGKMNIWKLFFTHLWTIEYVEEKKRYSLNITQFHNLELDYKITFYLKENEIFLDKLFEVNK